MPVAETMDLMAGRGMFFHQFEVPSNVKLEYRLVSERNQADVGNKTYQMSKARRLLRTYSKVVRVKDRIDVLVSTPLTVPVTNVV